MRSSTSLPSSRLRPFVFFCVALLSAFSQTARAEKPLTIGLMASLSGDFISIGQDCQAGYEIARKISAPDDLLDGRPLRFVYGDSASVANAGVSEFQRLIGLEGAVAVVAHRSQVLMALNPISEAHKVPLLGIAGAAQFLDKNPYAFRFWPSAVIESEVIAQTAERLKLSKIALISTQDEYTLSFREQLKKRFAEHRAEVVYDALVEPGDRDFRTQVARIKDKDADTILLNLTLAQLGICAKQIREAGLKQQLFGDFWVVSRDFVTAAGVQNVEGLIFSQVNAARPKLMEALQRVRPGATPSAAIYNCASALQALLQAISMAGSGADRAAVYDNLKKLDSIRMPDENIPFVNKEAVYPLAVHVYRNDVAEPVKWDGPSAP